MDTHLSKETALAPQSHVHSSRFRIPDSKSGQNPVSPHATHLVRIRLPTRMEFVHFGGLVERADKYRGRRRMNLARPSSPGSICKAPSCCGGGEAMLSKSDKCLQRCASRQPSQHPTALLLEASRPASLFCIIFLTSRAARASVHASSGHASSGDSFGHAISGQASSGHAQID